jgi:serine/threonine-protein kinase
MLYVGLEPYVRRFWPEAMVSWSRVLSGRFRDPLVGRDVLLGFTVMACLSALIWGWSWLMISRGALSPPVSDQGFTALRGGRFAVGALFSSPLLGLTIAFFLTLLFLLIRIVVRKTWIAVVLLALLWGAFQGLAWATVTPSDSALMAALAGWMYAGLVAAVLMTLLVRFGFLALVAEMVLGSWLASYPTTTDVSMPHFTTMLIGPAVVAVVAVLAYRVALAARP